MITTLRRYEARGFLLQLEEEPLNADGTSNRYDVKIRSADYLVNFRTESFDSKARATECFDHFMSLINQLVFEDFEQEFH